MAKNKSGFDVAIGVTRFFMHSHGIWPGFAASKYNRFSYLPAALMIIIFINVPQTIQLFYDEKDLNASLKILTLANVPIGIALVKLLCVSYNQKVIRQLIISLSEDWKNTTKQSELDVMWQKAKTSRTLSIVCIILGEGTIITYFIRSILVTYLSHLRSQKDLESAIFVKEMFMKAKFPYDTQSSPNYEITWVLQVIAGFLSAGVFSSIDALFITLVLHSCGQLINLQAAFKETINDKGVHFLDSLSELIKRHRRINNLRHDSNQCHFRFVEIIDQSFNIMFLFQVLFSTLLFCLQGYYFVTILSDADTEVLIEMIFTLYFSTCFLFSIFVYCYIAEFLQDECLNLGHVIFYSNWYNLPAKSSRLLTVCLMRVKEPLRITAGKFFVFSVNLFVNIVKTSVGYMSVLLAVRDKLN